MRREDMPTTYAYSLAPPVTHTWLEHILLRLAFRRAGRCARRASPPLSPMNTTVHNLSSHQAANLVLVKTDTFSIPLHRRTERVEDAVARRTAPR